MTRTIRQSERRAGFTLLEVIVVVLILTVFATMAVPRFTGTNRRMFELTVDRTADLMMMYAQREALSQQPVGIYHDRENNWLTLVILREQEDEFADGGTDWEIDRFVQPVKLPEFVPADNVFATEDGEPVDFSEWPLLNHPGETRPTISITLQSDDESATLRLPSYAAAPQRAGDASAQAASVRLPTDLDAAGRSREDW